MYHTLNTRQTGELEIVEVYDYYDFPILFSCKNKIDTSQFYMVFYADRLPDFDMWLYVEVSLDQLNLIRSSIINLNDTFLIALQGLPPI